MTSIAALRRKIADMEADEIRAKAAGYREIEAGERITLPQQIGGGNILAVSGGRVTYRRTGITLPCGNGYSVEVDLAGNDTYTVARVFSRAGQRFVKGERSGVYCDQISETVYRAGMFRDEWV